MSYLGKGSALEARQYSLMDYIKEVDLIRIEPDSPFFPKDWVEKRQSVRMVMPKAMHTKYADSIRLAEAHIWGLPNSSDARRAGFFGYLITQCELASAYKFPENTHRDFDTSAVDSTTAAATAATELARILRNYQQPYAFPICHSILETGVHLRTVEDEEIDPDGLIELEGYGCFPDFRSKIPVGMVGGGPAYSVRLAELLEAFSIAIEKEGVLAQRGPFEYRFRCGPLTFPKALEGKGDTPDAETCLAVFLSFLIRRFTATGGMRWGKGERCSGEGKPHWPLVEQLVCDALLSNSSVIARNAQQFLRRNPNVGVCGYQ